MNIIKNIVEEDEYSIYFIENMHIQMLSKLLI